MFKRLSVVAVCAVFFIAVFLGAGQGLWTVKSGSTLAEEAKKCACKYGCACEHCRGKSLECPCGKEAKAKCEKCGHERCPTNCERCPDCVIERQRERPGY